MDDEEGATLQQLTARPLDHVPDSHGSAGGSQSAHRLRGPVQTVPVWEEDDCGTGQLGRVGGFSLHAAGGGERARAKEAGAYLPAPKGIKAAPPVYLSPSASGGNDWS